MHQLSCAARAQRRERRQTEGARGRVDEAPEGKGGEPTRSDLCIQTERVGAGRGSSDGAAVPQTPSGVRLRSRRVAPLRGRSHSGTVGEFQSWIPDVGSPGERPSPSAHEGCLGLRGAAVTHTWLTTNNHRASPKARTSIGLSFCSHHRAVPAESPAVSAG
jgi:hypothetical protein